MNWKIKDIELANISRFRGELMGAAMLFIILFHVALPREDAFFRASQNGQCRCKHVPLSQRNRSLVLVDEESFCQAFLHPPLSAHLPYLAHHSLPLSISLLFPGRKHLELDLSLWRNNHKLGVLAA